MEREKPEILPAEHPIILFDGVCNFCNGFVQFVIENGGDNFRFAPLQSETGHELLDYFNMDNNNYDTFVLVRDDLVFKRTGALIRVLKHLGTWKYVAYLLLLVPRQIRDFFYRLFSRHRYSILGKRDRCMVPDEDEKDLFIDGD